MGNSKAILTAYKKELLEQADSPANHDAMTAVAALLLLSKIELQVKENRENPARRVNERAKCESEA